MSDLWAGDRINNDLQATVQSGRDHHVPQAIRTSLLVLIPPDFELKEPKAPSNELWYLQPHPPLQLLAMWWGWFVCRCLSLAALLVVADCGGAEQRRGAEEGLRSSTAKANSSSGRKYHRIQQGQCSYTFILPEGDGGACRDFKAGTPYNANTPQQDAPQPEADSSNQKSSSWSTSWRTIRSGYKRWVLLSCAKDDLAIIAISGYTIM